MRLASTPLTAANACVTWSLETPTRRLPVISLKYTRRSAAAMVRHCASRRARSSSSGKPRRGSRCTDEPFGQAELLHVHGVGQQQGDSLGQVAYGLIAFHEQPFRQAAASCASSFEKFVRHQLAGFAPGKEEYRPGRVRRGGTPKIVLQRCLFRQV